jgi:flagellar assembly factor FliW
MFQVYDENNVFRFSSADRTCCMFYIMSQIQHHCDKLFTIVGPTGLKYEYRFRVDTAIISPDGSETIFRHTGEAIERP